MNRNALYFIIGLLVLAGAAMGYQLYRERQTTDRVEIEFGKNGLSIQKK